MRIPPGEVIRLTEAEVLSHPLYQGFGPFADAHPPMRGWLATSVCGDDGRKYGLLQLSDKSGGRDFDESDEANIHELAALIGETLDALRLAAQRPAQRRHADERGREGGQPRERAGSASERPGRRRLAHARPAVEHEQPVGELVHEEPVVATRPRPRPGSASAPAPSPAST